MYRVNILLVEDNEGDILLTTEALETMKIIPVIRVVRNGKEAIDFLLKQGKYENEEVPDLVLLDINLPLKNGHEVLDVIKTNQITKHIPVIMLTTSSAKEDILKAYSHHANLFITKPVDIKTFQKAVETIENFWFQYLRIPTST